MISVLLPTRGRPGLAAEAIASLRDLAVGDVEVLLRIDDDDMYARTYRALLTDLEHVWIAIGPRLGYRRLHEYVNELGAIAEGTHLLLWNDDALMQTAGWDRISVEAITADVPAVGTPGGVDHPFPLVSRAFYDTLGHFSGGPHCDHWVCEVGKAADCMLPVDIEIAHLRDELDDETKREGVVAQEQVTLPELCSPEMQYRRQCDVDRIRAAIAA